MVRGILVRTAWVMPLLVCLVASYRPHMNSPRTPPPKDRKAHFVDILLASALITVPAKVNAKGQAAKLDFNGVGEGSGSALDCILEDQATRQCLIRKGGKPPVWQGIDAQFVQDKFIKGFERLQGARKKLDKKMWGDAESLLWDDPNYGLRFVMHSIIDGLPEQSQPKAREQYDIVVTSLEALQTNIRQRKQEDAISSLSKALGGLEYLAELSY